MGMSLNPVGFLDGFQGKEACWMQGKSHLLVRHRMLLASFMECQGGFHPGNLFLAEWQSLWKLLACNAM